MFKLSYNSNGLRYINPTQAIKDVSLMGYNGIELSLDPTWISYNNTTKEDLNALAGVARANLVEFAALATGDKNLLGPSSFEPSLINENKNGRKLRINLLKQSIKIAETLGIERMNFASGVKRPEVSDDEAMTYLLEGITACLKRNHDVMLMIEPEPGMFIETTDQAIALINEINDERFRLNLDVGHVVCCEDNYLEKIRNACKYTEHVHFEDIKDRVHRHLIPGKGNADLAGILQILSEEGYSNYVSVELYDEAYVYMTAMRESIDYINGLLNVIIKKGA